MTTDLVTLSTDHLHFARLLDLLDARIENFHNGETQDPVAMLEIVHYMTEYADIYHHPKEDLVMHRLMELDPLICSVTGDLLRQHEQITRAGTRLLESLTAVVAEDFVPRATVEAAARHYAAAMRTHMEIEEVTLFPAAAQLLQDADWAAINTAITRMDDPLFDVAGESRYQTLLEYMAA